jgi:hypothetical protein
MYVCWQSFAVGAKGSDMSEDKPEEKPAKPEIVVDEDWKAEAQAEKEKLAQQEAAPGARQAGRPGDRKRPLPQASFATLVSSLATQALFAMGGIEDPQTKQRFRDLELARFHIDTLVILEAKTKGNLTEEEKRALDSALYEVRMAYVRVAGGGM